MIQDAELVRRFKHHPPTSDEQIRCHQTVRASMLETARVVGALLPEGREKSLFLTKMEEAAMWAHAAIARPAGIRVRAVDLPDVGQEGGLVAVDQTTADEIARGLLKVLDDIFPRIWERGHPGYPALRSEWIPEDVVDGWGDRVLELRKRLP